MLKYTGNEQTIHYTNWLLHTYRSDLDGLIAKAKEKARLELVRLGLTSDELDGELEGQTVQELAYLLDNVVLFWMTQELFPNTCTADLNELLYREFETVESFADDDTVWTLFAPLLSEALSKINFDAVARTILTANRQLVAN